MSNTTSLPTPLELPPSIILQIRELGQTIQAARIAVFIGLSILISDFFATLADEVRFYWTGRMTVPRFLYFVIRYVTFPIQILNAIAFFDPPSDKFCMGYTNIQISLDLILLWSVQAILIIRITATYSTSSPSAPNSPTSPTSLTSSTFTGPSKSKTSFSSLNKLLRPKKCRWGLTKLGGFLWLLLMIVIIVEASLGFSGIDLTTWSATPLAELGDKSLRYCVPNDSTFLMKTHYLTWIPTLIFDSIIFLLSLYKFLQVRATSCTSGSITGRGKEMNRSTTLLCTLLHDSLAYYAFLFAAAIAYMTVSRINVVNGEIASNIIIPLISSAGTRLLLHIRTTERSLRNRSDISTSAADNIDDTALISGGGNSHVLFRNGIGVGGTRYASAGVGVGVSAGGHDAFVRGGAVNGRLQLTGGRNFDIDYLMVGGGGEKIEFAPRSPSSNHHRNIGWAIGSINDIEPEPEPDTADVTDENRNRNAQEVV